MNTGSSPKQYIRKSSIVACRVLREGLFSWNRSPARRIKSAFFRFAVCNTSSNAAKLSSHRTGSWYDKRSIITENGMINSHYLFRKILNGCQLQRLFERYHHPYFSKGVYAKRNAYYAGIIKFVIIKKAIFLCILSKNSNKL